MAVPTTIADLSTTAALNSPAGSDNLSTADDYLRAIQGIVKTVYTDSSARSETLTNKTVALGSNTVSGTTAQFNTALTDGDFATLAGTETLTNKTVNLTSNTVVGTTAQFNTALSDGDFATLAGSETLTNKALNGSLGATTPSTVVATTIVASSTIKGATTIAVGNATPSASGAGITFPATQSDSTDVNTLDDYEEGTWTPTITFNSTDGNLAYSVQVGRYTKIGNLVYVGGKIVFSQTTASSYLWINNLPFAAKNVTNYFPSTGIGVTGMTGIVGGVVANVQANDVTAYLFTGTTGAYGVLSASFCNGGSAEIDFGFTYLSN